MKLNIAQNEPARVDYPVRLTIRTADLSAYQAATLSHRTFVDATVNLGPEDFADDRVRLAARDLSSLLRSEMHWTHCGFSRSSDTSSKAGKLEFEVAYPFKEADIRQAVIEMVNDAARQQEFVESTRAACETWIKQVESAFRKTATTLLKKHKKLLSLFDTLQSRRQAAIERLDSVELQSVVDDYRDLARAFPGERDIESAFAKAIPPDGLPTEARRLAVNLYSSSVMRVMYMNDSSDSTRTSDPEPSLAISVAVTCGDEQYMTNRTTLEASVTCTGSLINSTKIESKVIFTDLDPLLNALYKIEKDWGKHGGTIMEDLVPDDIQDAMRKINARAIAEEAEAWINRNGSPSLKLGHTHKFSMTRQYRIERAQSVLAELLAPYPGWALVLAGDVEKSIDPAPKASPSTRALNVLVGVKCFANEATILYAAQLNEETTPENGEYVWIPEGQCFPNAPGIAVCWPNTATIKNTRKSKKRL